MKSIQGSRMKQKRPAPIEFFDLLESPLGLIYLIFIRSVLRAISFQKPKGMIFKKTRESSLVKKELSEYFGKNRTAFTCPTRFTEGTDFEKNVWQALKEIPYGETKTYKWLAEIIGKPQASRAVGQALSKNPIPIIFPCHRIIESDGSIGGYSAGTDIKRRLLEIEYYTKLSQA